MSTQLIHSLHNVTMRHQGAVVTIGNFDGVHRGHQYLLEKVITTAKRKKAPSLVITFEPHPFEFFNRDHLTIPRITRFREKFSALRACGVDYVLILPFNQLLANISASDFVSHILCETLAVKEIIIGDDFHFGYKREGDIHLLKEWAPKCGFSVIAMSTLKVAQERVSSTRVREALLQGNLKLAEELLGHPYTMMGRISWGDQRGRLWGFPTANIFLHRKLTPIRGVYTVLLHGIADKGLPGVANIGIRPTVDGTRTLLEVHLLDFNQEIYGRYVTVQFCQKLRDEIRYPNLDLLKEQIGKDVIAAHDFFSKGSL